MKIEAYDGVQATRRPYRDRSVQFYFLSVPSFIPLRDQKGPLSKPFAFCCAPFMVAIREERHQYHGWVKYRTPK